MSDQDQDELQQKIDGFMDKLKHGKLSEQGSFAIASSTLSILRLLIEDSSWKSAQDLMASVRQEGRGLISRCGQTSVSSIGTSFFDLFWILNTRRIIISLNCIRDLIKEYIRLFCLVKSSTPTCPKACSKY